jgi:hypothetical protein
VALPRVICAIQKHGAVAIETLPEVVEVERHNVSDLLALDVDDPEYV